MAKKRKHSREKKINKNRNSRFTKICSIIIGLWSITTVYIDSSQNGQSLNDQSAVDKVSIVSYIKYYIILDSPLISKSRGR